MRKITFLAVSLFLIAACWSGVFAETYEDGAYRAAHSFVQVEVVIEQGEIRTVEIIDHGGGGQRYRDMIEPLTDEVISAQCADVEAITGATVSSEHFKKAVKKALDKAKK